MKPITEQQRKIFEMYVKCIIDNRHKEQVARMVRK